MLVHTGVVVAFLGPLGEGQGAGTQSITVSIDGVAVSQGEDGAPTAVTTTDQQVQQVPLRDRVPLALNVRQPQSPISKAPQSLRTRGGGSSSAAAQATQPAPASGTEGGGGVLGTLYSQPRLVSLPKPAYPPTARARGLEGKVGIRVSITPHGTVEAAEVVQSSGVESFDHAAQESALQAHFQPAVQGGVAAPSQKTIMVTFSLLE